MKGLFLLLIWNVNVLLAQDINDYVWEKKIVERTNLPYQEVREADVFWSKRLWRVIDLHEKQNLIFSYPNEPLAKILHELVLNNAINAYDNSVVNGDQFKMKMTKEAIQRIGTSSDSLWILNAETGEEEQIEINATIDFNKVKRFKIKEDWFFNSATSTMEVRIIGLAPLIEVYDQNGNYLGDETMYWLYFPDIRPYLAKYEAYNPHNFAQRLSWDDIFISRRFSSYIYMEDNVYDRTIYQYAQGKDALYESERIKTMIFNFEHDLWSY